MGLCMDLHIFSLQGYSKKENQEAKEKQVNERKNLKKRKKCQTIECYKVWEKTAGKYEKNDEILHENRRTICLETWKLSWRYQKERNKYENKEIQGLKIWIKQKKEFEPKEIIKKMRQEKNIEKPKKKKKWKEE